jgi:hypothetical protein
VQRPLRTAAPPELLPPARELRPPQDGGGDAPVEPPRPLLLRQRIEEQSAAADANVLQMQVAFNVFIEHANAMQILNDEVVAMSVRETQTRARTAERMAWDTIYNDTLTTIESCKDKVESARTYAERLEILNGCIDAVQAKEDTAMARYTNYKNSMARLRAADGGVAATVATVAAKVSSILKSAADFLLASTPAAEPVSVSAVGTADRTANTLVRRALTDINRRAAPPPPLTPVPPQINVMNVQLITLAPDATPGNFGRVAGALAAARARGLPWSRFGAALPEQFSNANTREALRRLQQVYDDDGVDADGFAREALRITGGASQQQ